MAGINHHLNQFSPELDIVTLLNLQFHPALLDLAPYRRIKTDGIIAAQAISVRVLEIGWRSWQLRPVRSQPCPEWAMCALCLID